MHTSESMSSFGRPMSNSAVEDFLHDKLKDKHGRESNKILFVNDRYAL